MIKELTISSYFEQIDNSVLVDVRAPSEFQKGHIPGAVNIPLFSDEERTNIGKTYKQIGKDEAVLLGFEIAGPKWRSFIEIASQLASNKKIVLHCWRGGMRSQAMAWVLQFAGFHVSILKGGYKAYRNFVLNQFSTPYKLLVLGGKTGSRKTLVLHELRKLNQQVIDLEDLAQHNGSVYGSMNRKCQPTQEQFENELAKQLFSFSSDSPIWIEDESLRIGTVVLPLSLRKQMQNAPLIVVQLDLEDRVNYLALEYGVLPAQFLIDATKQIHKRLGPQNTTAAVQAIQEGRMKDFVRIMLNYYDNTYDYCVSKRQKDLVFHTDFQENSDEKTAVCLLDFIKKNTLIDYL